MREEKHKGLEWDKVSVWWLSRSSELHQIHGAVSAELPLSEFDGYPGKQTGKSLSCTLALIKRCQPNLLVPVTMTDSIPRKGLFALNKQI